ncbi:MAG: metallophosphoesterase family protein [Nanoarchaeota archaeon]|nr:metallophosphoesterase family protein [Nanoarchaeota archaeon]MBU4086298.1 metallophosphoesterase family protein [Nanoarchaeota archaeon]
MAEKKMRILAAGDIHGDTKLAEKLAKRAQDEKVDLVILTGDITGLIETQNLIKPFTDRKEKVVFVPGNWDSEDTAEVLSKLYGINNLDKYYLKHNNIGIFGLGNPGQLSLNEKEAFNKLKRNFDKVKELEKKIMVTHMHAKGTKSEASGFPGSSAIRKAIDKFQPDLFISGHIHELEGVEEKIGKTRVINVGRKGRIIEI